MIVLYTMHSESPNIRKVSMMLEETGLPYTVKRIDKQSDGRYPAEFLAVSPNATEKTGKLLPVNLQNRSQAIKWLMFEVANVGPVMGELYHYLLIDYGEMPAAILQRYKDRLVRYCQLLDQQLSRGQYLCGEYSIADIALYPWTIILEDMAEINLDDYPNLKNWIATIRQRPGITPVVQAGL
jgi:GST-like protein